MGCGITQWHTTALCSPTRSCLLTGRNHTRNSMACITEAASGFPNASGTIPPENGMLPEILGERGWNTYMVGKWHLCPTDEMNLASTRRNWPTGRGFERFYGFLGAETNQWYPDLVYDNHPVDQPKSPEEGYHLTEDLTDKALEFIKDAKTIAPDKPFFLYYAPGAAHAPHHAPKEWIDRYQGRFDMGYEAIREQTLARQKEMGIVPADTELPPVNPIGTPETRTGPDGQPFPPLDVTRPWDSLSADEKRLFCRMAEVYAGFLAHADHHIGRLLDYLEESGQRENTLVIVVSDNGASGEGGPDGSVNEMLFRTASPTICSANLAMIDELGGTEDLQPLPERVGDGVQHAVQDVEAVRVQRRHRRPVHHLLAVGHGRHGGEGLRHQYHHAIDIVPTILDTLGVDGTGHDQGPRAEPLRRGEHALQRRRSVGAVGAQDPVLLHARLPRDLARRLEGGHHASDPVAGGVDFNDDTWELYHTDTDRAELHDLAAEHPDKLRELVNLWFAEAGDNAGFPLDDRSAVEIITTPRPQLASPRDRYVYFPGTAEVPEAQAVNVRNRSYTIGALVDIPAPGAQGVLFAHGSRFGGHALYVKDNRLHYVYNFVGMMEQKIDATEDLPTGENLILSASFDKDGEDPPDVSTGILSLYHGDTKVGEGRIKTQPGMFSLAGEGLCVGRDSGEPVTGDYPGAHPHTVHRRHHQACRRRRQRRSLPRPRARGPGHARPRVAKAPARLGGWGMNFASLGALVSRVIAWADGVQQRHGVFGISRTR